MSQVHYIAGSFMPALMDFRSRYVFHLVKQLLTPIQNLTSPFLPYIRYFQDSGTVKSMYARIITQHAYLICTEAGRHNYTQYNFLKTKIFTDSSPSITAAGACYVVTMTTHDHAPLADNVIT